MSAAAYTVAWLLWGLLFAAIEGEAIFSKQPGATLSAHIWQWASLKNKGRGWRARRFAALAILAWLCAHLLTGGRF